MSVYISIGIEFFMYALDPVALDYMNGIIVTFHDKLKSIPIYNNIFLSKITTIVLLCIASMGTKAKKNLEFNAKKDGSNTAFLWTCDGYSLYYNLLY